MAGWHRKVLPLRKKSAPEKEGGRANEDMRGSCEERVGELIKEIEIIHATQREMEELMSRRRQGGSSSEESKSGYALSTRFDESKNEIIEIKARGYGRKTRLNLSFLGSWI